jgi:hypothetical protein
MATDEVVAGTVEPILQSVGSTVATQITEPGLVGEIGFSLCLLVLVISVHGWFMSSISRFFGARFARFTSKTRQWRVTLLMTATIAMLAIAHLLETLVWAAPIWLMGIIPDLRDAYFFVLEAYTTLGETKVSLPETWRLAGPMIAISGLFTFSWTGSVLVYVMTEIGRRHTKVGVQTAHHPAAPPASATTGPAPQQPPVSH